MNLDCIAWYIFAFQIIVDSGDKLPAGFQLLCVGTTVAVRTEWYIRTINKLQNKSTTFHISKLVEAMLDIREYAIKGGVKKLMSQASPRVSTILHGLEGMFVLANMVNHPHARLYTESTACLIVFWVQCAHNMTRKLSTKTNYIPLGLLTLN